MTKVPHQVLRTDLTKYPQILPKKMDAGRRESMVLFFSYILVVHLNILWYIYIYIIAKQGYEVPKNYIWGYNQKTDQVI